MSIDRRTVINIINNYDGVFAKVFEDKHDFDSIQVGHVPYVSENIKAIIIKKEWYEDGEYGIVRYKILGKVEIV